MATSKLKIKQSVQVEGTLRVEDGKCFIEIEEIGSKNLSELLAIQDGQIIKLSTTTVEEIFE